MFNDIPDSIKEYCDYIKTGKYDITQIGEIKYYGVKLQSINQKIWKKEGKEWI